MIVLGLDIGSTKTGIALLDVPPGALKPRYPSERARVLGVAHLGVDDTINLVIGQAGWVELIVFEAPKEIHSGFLRKMHAMGKGAQAVSMSRAIGQSKGVEGQVLAICKNVGLRYVEIHATEWRHKLVGKNNPENHEVASALAPRLDYGGRRTNNHHRDAAGAALWGAIKAAEEARRDEVFASIRAGSAVMVPAPVRLPAGGSKQLTLGTGR